MSSHDAFINMKNAIPNEALFVVKNKKMKCVIDSEAHAHTKPAGFFESKGNLKFETSKI